MRERIFQCNPAKRAMHPSKQKRARKATFGIQNTWTICQATQVLPQKATCSSLTALFQLTVTPLVPFAPNQMNKQAN